MAKDKYEISIWKDVLKPAANGVPAHYEEEKIAIIGSDTLKASCRAMEPKLVENVNGTNTFTFKMFYHCQDQELTDIYTQFAVYNEIDPYQMDFLQESRDLLLVFHELESVSMNGYDNPFLPLMVNERKIKVKWKNKWYDLVIKNCQEDSAGKSITYTCTDAFINELSKTGFNLIFDNELMNNQGTIEELGAKILEGSDWSVDSSLCDKILQENEEAVFELTVSSISATLDAEPGATSETISGTLLWFYPQMANLVNNGEDIIDASQKFQFAYAPSYITDNNSQLVSNAKSYTTSSDLTWSWYHNDREFKIMINGSQFTLNFDAGVSSRYRAIRIANHQNSVYDELTGKFCNVYSKTVSGQEHIIYGYQDTQVDDGTTIINVLTNSSNFTDKTGWGGALGDIKMYPALTSFQANYNGISYLAIPKYSSSPAYNEGISLCKNYLPEGLQQGSKYIFRYKMRNDNGNKPGTYYTGALTITIQDSHGMLIANNNNSIKQNGGNNWYYYEMTIINSVPYDYLDGAQIYFGGTAKLWIEEVQFYKKPGDNYVAPGDFSQSFVYQRYNYYDHTAAISNNITDINKLPYLYRGTSSLLPSGVRISYNNYEKIRSITGKQSNRFNLLQTAAEQFDCWVRFKINHDESGHIIYNTTGTRAGSPQKYVYFKKEIGQQTNVGFVYGIDLKTIQRTIQSDNIVTKTIVIPNTNEFALDGVCDIKRASNNYSKSAAIYNFDYYISQGMLDAEEITKDLYNQADGIGYYVRLHDYNTKYDETSAQVAELNMQQLKFQYAYDIAFNTKLAQTATAEESHNQINAAAGAATSSTFSSDVVNYVKSHTDSQISDLVESWRASSLEATNASNQVDDCASQLSTIGSRLTTLNQILDATRSSIDELDFEFYKKYSRFIQEGSWQDDSYIDDNLYYIDAVSLAYRSARPQISYNISVLRLSALDEFKSKVFNLGDITYIQDKEFFGYITIDGILTPYKEQVLVSEITSNFDEPSKDSFKVQNYKSAFDDLFQRVTAATQSLQFHEGEYARAANATTGTGAIKAEAIQMTLDSNKDLVVSAINDAVVQDANGITLSNINDPARKVRINSNGVFITTDGGNNWKNAIRSDGVATEALTAGTINTNVISLFQGKDPTFRWDFKGITAYSKNAGNTAIDDRKFVRFDKYGVYGIDFTSSSTAHDFTPSNEDDIWNNANFGMTWKGFFLKTKYGSAGTAGHGWFEISNEHDLSIWEYTGATESTAPSAVEVVHLGHYDIGGYSAYGMIIRDRNNNPVLNVDNSGNVIFSGVLGCSGGSIGSQTYIHNGMFAVNPPNSSYYIDIGGDDDLAESKAYITNNYPSMNLPLAKYGACDNLFYYGSGGVILKNPMWETSGVSANDMMSDAMRLSYTGLTLVGKNSLESIFGQNVTTYNTYGIEFNEYAPSSISMLNKPRNSILLYQANIALEGTASSDSDPSPLPGKLNISSGLNTYLLLSGGQTMGGPAWNKCNMLKDDWGLMETSRLYVGVSNEETNNWTDQPYISATSSGTTYDWDFKITPDRYNQGGGFERLIVTLKNPAPIGGKTVTFWGTPIIHGIEDDVTSYNPNFNAGEQQKIFDLVDAQGDWGDNYYKNVGLTKTTLGVVEVVHYTESGSTSTVNCGQLVGAWYGSFIGSSSRKIKRNIQPFDIRFNTLFNELNPVTFQYIDGHRIHYGLILDELKSALDKANISADECAAYCLIDQNDPNGLGGIRYEELIPLNIWQIQKLKTRVSELEERLARLESSSISTT